MIYPPAKILEYPDYNFYYIGERYCGDNVLQSKLDNGTLEFYQCWTRGVGCPRFMAPITHPTLKIVDPGSKIMLHKSCTIPSKMLKKYDVITSARTEAPDYYVFPDINPTDIVGSRVILFINHTDRAIIGLGPIRRNNWVGSERVEPSRYTASIRNYVRQEMPEWNADDFNLLDNEDHAIFWSEKLDDSLYLFMNHILPKDRIISESSLIVGEDDLTYDIFKSCYMMSKSADAEMRKAALITLAQHNCHGWEELIHWLLYYVCNYDRTIAPLKSSHSPFRWLYKQTAQYRRNVPTTFIRAKSISMGRKFVTDITQGAMHWENGCLIHQSYYRPIHEISALAKLLN